MANDNEMWKFNWEDFNTIFSFGDGGEVGHTNYKIMLKNGVYSCCYLKRRYRYPLGIHDAFFWNNIPEKYVTIFFLSIKMSVVSRWNGFDESDDNICDGGEVWLDAKFEKLNVDFRMKGYACAPDFYNEGKNIIINEYKKLIEKAEESFKGEYIEDLYFNFPSETNPTTKMRIDKPIFNIGREGVCPRNDFEIVNDEMISPFHASIITRNECLYIVDHNSTNKTFIKELGKSIEVPPGIEVQITKSTSFRFADKIAYLTTSEELYFRQVNTPISI